MHTVRLYLQQARASAAVDRAVPASLDIVSRLTRLLTLNYRRSKPGAVASLVPARAGRDICREDDAPRQLLQTAMHVMHRGPLQVDGGLTVEPWGARSKST